MQRVRETLARFRARRQDKKKPKPLPFPEDRSKMASYMDPDGIIRWHHVSVRHDPIVELKTMVRLDSVQLGRNQRWFAIEMSWLAHWLRFTSLNGRQPGELDNEVMLTPVPWRRPKPGLVIQKDFRMVNERVWKYLIKLYGGGPAVFVVTPPDVRSAPGGDKAWLTRVRLDEVAEVEDVKPGGDDDDDDDDDDAAGGGGGANGADAAAALLGQGAGVDKMRAAMAMDGEINQAAADAIGASLAGDMAKAKMQKAMAMDGEINQAAADAIGASLAADLGRNKMKEAEKLKEQADLENAGMLAQQMAGDAARRQMEEARKVEEEEKMAGAAALANSMAADAAKAEMQRAMKLQEEQDKEAAGAIGNMFAGDAAKRQMAAAAEEHKEELQQAAAENMAANFKAARGAAALKAALEAGDDDAAQEAAAGMLQGAYRGLLARRRIAEARRVKQEAQEIACAKILQNAYRGRLARKRAALIKAEKEEAKLNASARMVQSAWRIRCARKKAAALKEKKEEMRLNASARMVQCAWRAKKAREKVERLKAERQAKREEGCAIIVQSAWKRKKAREKVAALKAEKEQLMLEASACMVQCAWRRKQARDKVNALKAEKERLMLEAAAVMLQTAWRCKQARDRMGGLRQDRDENNGATKVQSMWKAKKAREEFKAQKMGALTLQTMMRRWKARRAVEAAARPIVRPMYVRLVSAAGLRAADNNASDPFVFLSVVRGGEQLCLNRSETIKSTLDPVWNQDLLLLASGDCQLVLTVCDWDRFGSNDFLGQAVLDLSAQSSGRAWSMGGAFTLDLGAYGVVPTKGDGKAMRLGDDSEAGQGTITFEVLPEPFPQTICGQVGRLSDAKLRGKGSIKQRTVVLARGALTYYDQDGYVKEEKGRIECSAITGVQEAEDGVHVAHSTGKDWVLQLPAAPKDRAAWLYKLRVSAGLPSS